VSGLGGFGLCLHADWFINTKAFALRRTKLWPRERAHFSASISFAKRILRVNGARGFGG
jgi:hypothetical protein